KIKQKKMELKMLIRQYKENSISTFYAKGIVSVKSVTAFYFDANKNSSQTGVMIFDIIDNGSKLEGIYIEVDDIRKPNPKKYSYILERRKFNFKENLQLFKNNNYDKVNNICFHE
ncbi:MAG: hypothetical protein J6P57_04595, partial [Lachnospiraceae bacterium]|nr:hypothetical protein [Lachnospiraceae bacterium]